MLGMWLGGRSFALPTEKPMTMNGPQTVDILGGNDFTEVLEQLKPEYLAIAEEDLQKVNTDVGAAAATALWAAARLEELRPELQAELPKFIPLLNKIVPIAQATIQAQFDHAAATTPVAAIPELEAKLTRIRGIFVADVEALVRREVIAANEVPELGTPNSHKNLAYGVGALVSLLRNNWEKIKTRTAVTLDEIAEGQELAQRLAVAIVVRDRGPGAATEAAMVRERMFAMLVRTYDELRRATVFLRWRKRDDEDFCPSLYVNQRSKPRGKTDLAPEKAEPSNAPNAPSGTSANSPVAAGGASSTGLPGSDPLG